MSSASSVREHCHVVHTPWWLAELLLFALGVGSVPAELLRVDFGEVTPMPAIYSEGAELGPFAIAGKRLSIWAVARYDGARG